MNPTTRVPGQEGVIAPKEKTLGSGSQFKVKGDNSAYENLGSTTTAEQQDPGITGETKTESKPDAGAKYESPKLIINFDSLIDLDQGELGSLEMHQNLSQKLVLMVVKTIFLQISMRY